MSIVGHLWFHFSPPRTPPVIHSLPLRQGRTARRFCALVALFWLMAVVPSVGRADPAPRVVSVTVDSVRRSPETFAPLLRVKAGDPYSPAAADADLKRLYATGAFDDVRLAVTAGDEGVRLVYHCLDRTFVSSLRFTDRLFSTQVLRNVVAIAPGEPLDQERLEEAPARLRGHYAANGYPDARVRLQVVEDPATKSVAVAFEIDRGKPQRLIARRLTGDVPMAHWRVKRKMELRLFDRPQAAVLAGERRRVIDYLRGRGYLGATVGTPQIVVEEGSRWVRLVVPIEAGVRTVFRVKGNRALSDSEVVAACGLARFAEVTEAARAQMAEGVAGAYRQEGYDEVRVEVAPPRSTGGDEQQRVTITVHEGRRRTVAAIDIDTGGEIDPAAIRAVMSLATPRSFGRRPWFRQDLFAADRAAIEAWLRDQGYYQAQLRRYEVEPAGDEAVAVKMEVQAGVRSMLTAVNFDGVTAFDPQPLLTGVAAGTPLRIEEVNRLRRRLLDAYHSRGYLEAQVRTHLTPLGDGRWRLQVVADEGQEVRTGATRIQGLDRTRPKVVKRELRYEAGEPLDPARLLESRQALSRLGLFQRIDIYPDPLLAGAAVQDVVVDVDEGQAGEVALAFGFGTEENLRTALEVSHRNPFGYGRPVAFLAQLSSLERTLSLSGREPYLFGTRTSLLLNVVDTTRQFENFTKKTTGTAGILQRKLTDHLDGSLGIQYDNASVSDITGDVVVTEAETGRIGIASFIASLLWDFRDNLVDPTRGVLLGADAQLATDFLLSERNFLKIGGQISTFVTPWEGWTTAAGLRLGAILPTRSGEEEPIQVRYFLGGRSTVRAFRQDQLTGDDPNQLGGSSFFLFNLEERFPLYHQLKGVVFADVGNVFPTEDPFDHLGDLRYSAGLGLRITTPVGPLRLDYGRKIDRQAGESSGELHFTLGHAF